jgi:hypothetical protein
VARRSTRSACPRLDSTTARLVQATAAGFARQAVMMQQLDVRQDGLETAIAMMSNTAQAAVNRVDGAQAEIYELKQRIRALNSARGTPR